MYGRFIELPEFIAQSSFDGFWPSTLPGHFLTILWIPPTTATLTTKNPNNGEIAINSSIGMALATLALYRLRQIAQPLDERNAAMTNPAKQKAREIQPRRKHG